MTTAIQRKVTIDKHGKPVISNLRVPFQRGETVWVQTSADTVVVTSVEREGPFWCVCTQCMKVTVEKPEEVSDGE